MNALEKGAPEKRESEGLERRLGLTEAVALNMIEIVGIGPFVVSALVIREMGGPQAMIAWIAGALLAVFDGFVWSELGAAMPRAGGTYVFLREAYGPGKWGRLLSFLFMWQSFVYVPLSVASASIGFARYAGYLHPLTSLQARAVSGGLVVLLVILLYRRITTIGKISVLLWAGVVGTMLWLIWGGLTHFNATQAFSFPPHAFDLNTGFVMGLGSATLIAMYDYGGYNNVSFFAGEVKDPGRVIPRSILFAVIGVAGVYLVMNVTILGVIPWREAVKSQAVVSDFIQRLYGSTAARIATVLVLWTAFASVFAVMLGYSRVPFAAAVEGNFFAPFAKLHPTKNFPAFSVVTLGVTSGIACLLDLESLVKALMVIQVMIQFLAQVVAVTLIRRNRPDIVRPFSMWAYPYTSIVAFGGWLFILLASGWTYIAAGLGLLIAGIAAYLVRAKRIQEWPYES